MGAIKRLLGEKFGKVWTEVFLTGYLITVKYTEFDTLQVVNCFKVESDAASPPS